MLRKFKEKFFDFFFKKKLSGGAWAELGRSSSGAHAELGQSSGGAWVEFGRWRVRHRRLAPFDNFRLQHLVPYALTNELTHKATYVARSPG